MKQLVKILSLSVSLLLVSFASAEEAATDGFGDWSKICAPEGETEVCQISQTVNQTDLGQRLFQTIIGYVPESTDPVIYFTAPLGMYLPRGITLELTKDTLLRAVVQRCDATGCLAVTKLEPGFVTAMMAGAEGRLIFGSTAEQNIAVPLSLKGFTAALASIQPEVTEP